MSSEVDSPRLSGPVPGIQRLTQAQFAGVIALLVGVSQQFVGILVLDGLSTFVVGGRGSLLMLFGYNLVRNRGPFESGWNKNGEQGPLSLLILALATASLVVAAGLLLVG